MKNKLKQYARRKKSDVDIRLRVTARKETAERLKQLREEKGWTLKTAAKMIICQPSTPEEYRPKNGQEVGDEEFAPERLKLWEYGDNRIDSVWYSPICEMYGCDLDYLFGRIPTKRHRSFEMSKLTGLSEDAVNALVALGLKDPHLSQMFSRIIPLPAFKDFLISCDTYTRVRKGLIRRGIKLPVGTGADEFETVLRTREWCAEEKERIEKETDGLFTLAAIDTVPLARELDAQNHLHKILEMLAEQEEQKYKKEKAKEKERAKQQTEAERLRNLIQKAKEPHT